MTDETALRRTLPERRAGGIFEEYRSEPSVGYVRVLVCELVDEHEEVCVH